MCNGGDNSRHFKILFCVAEPAAVMSCVAKERVSSLIVPTAVVRAMTTQSSAALLPQVNIFFC